MYIYIRLSVTLSSCLAWARVRDKLASLPMHERVRKSLSLAGLLYKGRGDLRFLSPRRVAVSPSVDVGRL